MLLRMFMFRSAFLWKFSSTGTCEILRSKTQTGKSSQAPRCEGDSIEVTCITQVIVCPWLCVRCSALRLPGIRGRKHLCESVIAGGDTALHAGFEDGVANLA